MAGRNYNTGAQGAQGGKPPLPGRVEVFARQSLTTFGGKMELMTLTVDGQQRPPKPGTSLEDVLAWLAREHYRVQFDVRRNADGWHEGTSARGDYAIYSRVYLARREGSDEAQVRADHVRTVCAFAPGGVPVYELYDGIRYLGAVMTPAMAEQGLRLYILTGQALPASFVSD